MQVFGGAEDLPLESGLLADQLAVGLEHSCALSEGRIACWGDNGAGQLGLGDDVPFTPTPTWLPDARTFVQLVAGDLHTCALAETGTVLCWGSNEDGQLGQTTVGGAATPAVVQTAAQFEAIAAGAAHTCGLTRDDGGALLCWGANEAGQLGDGSRDARRSPVEVAEGEPADWIAVTAGARHTCGLRGGGDDRDLYCWGANERGQIGVGEPAVETFSDPVIVGTEGWRRLALGANHTCASRFDGAALCWGAADDGALGFASGVDVRFPQPVPVDGDVLEVRAGPSATCLRAGDRLLCAGLDEGRFGDVGDRTAPLALPVTGRDIALGARHACLIDLEGGVRCAGANDRGQLGTGETEPTLGFAPVSAPTER